MAIVDLLKAPMALLRADRKRWGMTTRHHTLFLNERGDANVGIVQFQKSMTSTAAEMKVVVNYGVYSRRLGDALDDEPSVATSVPCAHYLRRLQRDGQEVWFRFAATDDPAQVAAVLTRAVDDVMPDLLAHLSDEQLRDYWLSGKGWGPVELVRLAVMLKLIGPRERLPEVLAELDVVLERLGGGAMIRHNLAWAMARVPP